MGNETEIEYNPRTSIGYIQFLPLQNIFCKIYRFHQIEKKRNVACRSIKNFEIELEDRNKI